MPGTWFRRDESGLRLAVRVQPRAGADRVAGLAVGGVQQLPVALAGLAATIGPGLA